MHVIKAHIIVCGSNQVTKSLTPASCCNLHCSLPPLLCQQRHLLTAAFIFQVNQFPDLIHPGITQVFVWCSSNTAPRQDRVSGNGECLDEREGKQGLLKSVFITYERSVQPQPHSFRPREGPPGSLTFAFGDLVYGQGLY